MAEIRGFRERNVAIMAAGCAGCVVAVDGVARRYELAPPENAEAIMWDRGEGLIRRRGESVKPFTSFDILAPYLDRWAKDQATEDAAAEAERQERLRAAREADRRAQEAFRGQLATIVDERIEAKNG